MINQQGINMKPLLIALSVSVLSGCASGFLPKVPVETHCRYAARGVQSYESCIEHQKQLREQRMGAYGYNPTPDERPLFDESGAMDAETRALMDMSVDESPNQALVVRDAFYQQDHKHSNHEHNDNLIHDKAKLNSLAVQIQQLQNQLDVSIKHKDEHKQIETMYAKHQKDW